MDKNYLNNNNPAKLEIPEPSGWQCYMFGMGNDFILYPRKGNVPNFFWRWMQWLFFGNRWVKIPNHSVNQTGGSDSD